MFRKKLISAIFILSIIGVSACQVNEQGSVDALATGIIYEGKWDQHQDLRGFYWHDTPPPAIVTDRVRTGTHALHVYLRALPGGTKDRCELMVGKDNNAVPDTQGAIQLEYGKRYWFAISIWVPEDLPDMGRSFGDVVLQMHGKPDYDGDVKVENSRSPNLNLSVVGDDDVWLIKTKGDDRRVTPVNKSFQFSHSFRLPLVRGEWVDWVFEMLLSYHDDGELRIWQNGTLVYEGFHKNTWNDDRGPHLSFGLYAWWADNDYGIDTYREYWHDHFKLAEGEDMYDVVSPDGMIPPTPIPPTETPMPTFTPTPTLMITPTPTIVVTATPIPEHDHDEILGRIAAIETQQVWISERLSIIEALLRDVGILIFEKIGEATQ